MGVPARVASVEYDPNRSANIALLHYADGEKRYILQPVGLKVGMTIQEFKYLLEKAESYIHSRISRRLKKVIISHLNIPINIHIISKYEISIIG